MTDRLRPRLLVLRADALDRLAEADGIDGGMLALLGNVGAALDALDAVPVDAAPVERAVVVDDGTAIRLVLYDAAGAVAAVVIEPARAVRLAGELIASARHRL
jgi:hypothetical protein